MANFTGLQAAIAALTTDVELKEKAFSKLLLNESLEGNFTVVPNLQKGMLTPTFEVGTGVRPFSSTMAAADTQVIGAKTFTLFPNKIEEEINPQKYYDFWEAMGLKGSFDPNNFPLENYIVERLIQINAEQIRNTEIWSGVRNNAGSSSSDIIDGFSKIIGDSITSGALPATYIDSSIGVPTPANIIDAVEAVVKKLTPQYRKQADTQVLLSETLYYWYWDAYKAANMGMKPDTDNNGDEIIMEKWRNIRIKKEISMSTASSNRILCSTKSNLQVGTNASSFKDYTMKVYDKGWLFNILMYFELAVGIYEFNHGAIAVNDQV